MTGFEQDGGRVDGGARRRRAGSSASASCWPAACGRATWPRVAGASVPLWPAAHVHVRTVPIEGATADLPVIRDLDAYFYVRHANGALLVGAFEPDGKPLDPAIAAAGLLVRRARARLGALRAGARARGGAHPGAARRRVRAVPERARVVHARCRLLHRRDRRGRRACTSPPASTARASSTRPARAGRSRSGSSRAPPTRDVPGLDVQRFAGAAVEPALPARAHTRGPRPPVRDALAVPAAAHRAQHPPHAAARPGRGRRRRVRRDRRLRARQLVRAGRHAARVRLQLRPPELVRARGRRASRGAHGGGAVRPLDVHEARGRRPGRAAGRPAGLHAGPRRARRPRRLHADAERARRHRDRRHRHAPRRATGSS